MIWWLECLFSGSRCGEKNKERDEGKENGVPTELPENWNHAFFNSPINHVKYFPRTHMGSEIGPLVGCKFSSRKKYSALLASARTWSFVSAVYTVLGRQRI